MKKIDVKITKDSKYGGEEATKYQHPSYGIISVTRRGAGGKGVKLFGSDVNHDAFFTITISECIQESMLGRNWYFGNKSVIEIDISPAQFVEMFSNINSEGIPCTISTHPEHGKLEYNSPPSQVDYASDYPKKMGESGKVINIQLAKRAKEILSQSGTIKKAEKDELIELLRKLEQEVHANLDFAVESAEKAIDKMKSSAMMEVDARLTQTIVNTGLEVLKNPELAKNFISHKENKK